MSGVGLFDDPDDDAWLVYRLGIFKNFTLKSILNQSVKPDLLWLSFDGRENNPWIKALEAELQQKLPTVITHNGLIYKDDKYIIRLTGNEKYQSSRVQAYRMLGRAIRRKKPKIFIRYLSRLLFKNKTLAERMDKSLERVREKLGEFSEFSYVYLTRMDSDDMIHRDWIKELGQYDPKYRQSFVRNKGYVYNGSELAEWNPTTCPQFFTVCIPSNVFNKGKFWVDYWGDYKSHEDANKVFSPVILDDYKYLMLMHGNQISSTWNHPFRGKEIKDLSILNDFGDFGLVS